MQKKAPPQQIRSAVLQEIARRAKKSQAPLESPRKRFDPQKLCADHPKQLKFINDKSKFKAAHCSRRAGKTYSIAVDIIATAVSVDDIELCYITLSRTSAKRILWRQLLKFNADYELGAHINQTELTLTFPNNSIVHLAGAKDQEEIEKFRGMAFYKVYIDECQSFKSFFGYLVEEILLHTLKDYDGQLILTGTPNAICAGPFYEACHNEGDFKGYSVHHWSIIDNVAIEEKSGKSPKDMLAEELARRQVDSSDPKYRRESLGLWVKDLNSLVFKFDAQKNTFAEPPRDIIWDYVIGVDLGFDDAFALSVLAYSTHHPAVYHVDEYIKPGLTPTECAQALGRYVERYKPTKVVADTGGLGKAIVEEFKQRHNLDVVPAEKKNKFEYIELFNDDLQASKFKVFNESQATYDWQHIEWDDSKNKRSISTGFHSDVADAILYAWRECYHYLFEAVADKPKRGSAAYYERLEQAWLDADEKAFAEKDENEETRFTEDAGVAFFEDTLNDEDYSGF